MAQSAAFKSRMIEKSDKSHWSEHHLYQNMSICEMKRSVYEYMNIYICVYV